MAKSIKFMAPKRHRDILLVEKEAVLVHSRGVHYCDGIEAYFAELCSAEEARKMCDEFNKNRAHIFDDYMEFEETSYGCLLIVVTPYND